MLISGDDNEMVRIQGTNELADGIEVLNMYLKEVENKIKLDDKGNKMSGIFHSTLIFVLKKLNLLM